MTPFERDRRRQIRVGVLVLAIMGLLPFAVRDIYFQNILVLTVMYAALSQAWNILGGYCGQISLGYALYFGLGAYTSTLLFTKFGISPWVGMGTGGLLGAALALLIGWPTFRLAGHYFTIATIVVAEIGYLLVLNWSFAGEASGIQIIVTQDSWADFSFLRSKLPYYYFVLGLAAVTWLVCWLIEDSKWGYWWQAVRENPDAAASLGVRVFRTKMAAAALSAFFAAVGGSFYAQFVSYIDPDAVLVFQFSLLMALPAVLGGIGTLWGPALGAAILIPVSELTRSYIGGGGRGIDLLLYGSMIMLVALARPQGLISLFPHARQKA
jgi:branched-chain amino acid transport system permease protein